MIKLKHAQKCFVRILLFQQMTCYRYLSRFIKNLINISIANNIHISGYHILGIYIALYVKWKWVRGT